MIGQERIGVSQCSRTGYPTRRHLATLGRWVWALERDTTRDAHRACHSSSGCSRTAWHNLNVLRNGIAYGGVGAVDGKHSDQVRALLAEIKAWVLSVRPATP
jgi:hypothetical protein